MRRQFRWAFVVIPVTAVLAVWYLLAIFRVISEPAMNSCGAIPDGALNVTFGLGRESLTRTRLVDLTGGSSATDPKVAVRLQSDLRRDGGGAQFPSSQITVGSTMVDTDTVAVTAAVSPASPELAPGGCYQGDLLISKTTGRPQNLPIVVDMANREGGIAWLAFGTRAFGALLGLLVKWITESLTPIAEQRRRLDSLRRSLGIRPGESDVLPLDVQGKLTDLEERINRQDLADVSTIFKSLEEHREITTRALGRIRELKAVIEDHQNRVNEIVQRPDSPAGNASLRALINRERDQLYKLRQLSWPRDHQEFHVRADRLAYHLTVFGEFIPLYAKHADDSRLRDAMDHFLGQEFEESGFEEGRVLIRTFRTNPPPSAEDITSPAAIGPAPRPHVQSLPRPRRFMDVLIQYARILTALASVLIVAFVGLNTQYLSAPAFTDDLGSWLGLFLWAAVIELSGVSILDVVAKLGTSAATRTK